MVGAAELVDHMKKCGVNKAVVFGFPWESVEIARMHNDYVLRATERFPDSLIPFACSGIATKNGVNELERCSALGFRGIGELAFYTGKSTDEQLRAIAPVIEMCREKNLVLLVHSNEPVGHEYPGKARAGLRFYYELAKMCKDMPLVLAHWGGGLFFYATLKKEATEVLRNVYYDTAASPYLYHNTIYKLAVEIVGSDKILFGSDFPLLSPSRYFDEMSDAGLPNDDISKITGANAKKLLGI